MKINDIEITSDTVLATRSHFINNCNACILGACSCEFRVNDLPKYIDWQKRYISSIAKGESDHTLAFLQQAVYIQTGNCIAILP